MGQDPATRSTRQPPAHGGRGGGGRGRPARCVSPSGVDTRDEWNSGPRASEMPRSPQSLHPSIVPSKTIKQTKAARPISVHTAVIS